MPPPWADGMFLEDYFSIVAFRIAGKPIPYDQWSEVELTPVETPSGFL